MPRPVGGSPPLAPRSCASTPPGGRPSCRTRCAPPSARPRRLRASAILLAAALAVACAPRVRPVVIAAREMSDDDVRAAAGVMAMADARRFDPAVVDRALASGTPYVRRMATIAVGQAGGSAAAGRLRLLLTDSDSGVAANAAFALGLLKDTASVAL